MDIIKVDHLSKTYEYYNKQVGLKGSIHNFFHRETLYKKAVKDISFKVSQGEIVGFLGPNGAGKTTTLKMLSGILCPTSGEIDILGYKPFDRKNELKTQFAIVMGQKSQIWWDLPPVESFDLIRTIYKLDMNTYKKNLDELVETMGVSHLISVPTRNLSLGERMKMELIAALIYQPKILFLDEPTIGLDFMSRKNIYKFIQEYNKKKKTTIMLTSHYMSDIEALCDRIIIINKGKILFDDSLNKIKELNLNEKIVKIKCEDEKRLEVFSQFGTQIGKSETELALRVDTQKLGEVANLAYSQNGIDLTIEELPIEDIIEKFFYVNGDKENNE